MEYKTYTTEYDKVVSATQLATRDPLSTRSGNGYVNPIPRRNYERLSKMYFDEDMPNKAAKIANKLNTHDWDRLGNIAVSVVIDHSGSLISNDGLGSIITRLAIELISGTLCLLGVNHEILGFTTRSWQGGYSRQKWLRDRQPSNPGRLCDLLHIVYRTHDDVLNGPPIELSNLFRSDLLKENIDGEALEWSYSRLTKRPEKRKILIWVSDGAPVDDSTLMENPPGILHDHFMSTLQGIIIKSDVELYGVGINHSLVNWFPNSVFLASETELSQRIFLFIEQLLVNHNNRV